LGWSRPCTSGQRGWSVAASSFSQSLSLALGIADDNYSILDRILQPFEQITELTDVPEGTIVRVITRLDQTCQEVRDAARVIGDAGLFQKMEDAQTKIKRDIVFAASLCESPRSSSHRTTASPSTDDPSWHAQQTSRCHSVIRGTYKDGLCCILCAERASDHESVAKSKNSSFLPSTSITSTLLGSVRREKTVEEPMNLVPVRPGVTAQPSFSALMRVWQKGGQKEEEGERTALHADPVRGDKHRLPLPQPILLALVRPIVLLERRGGIV
jgi:hypothetical protein